MSNIRDILGELKELDSLDNIIDDILFNIDEQKETLNALENYVKDVRDIVINCVNNIYSIVDSMEE